MDEQDIEQWFEEEKEKLANEYYKKITSYIKVTDEDEASKTVAKKEVKGTEVNQEEIYLQRINELREEYAKKYSQLLEKKDAEELRKKKKIILKYKMYSFTESCKSIYADSIRLLLKAMKNTGILFSNVMSVFKAIKYYIKEFYTFRMKKYCTPIIFLSRKSSVLVVRPLKKKIDYVHDLYNSLIKKLLELFHKILDISIKRINAILKKLSEKWKKISAVIEKISKKVSAVVAVFTGPIQKFMSKFKKEDSED